MFELVEIFKQEQSDTEVSIAQLDTGSQPPKKAIKSVDKDKKIGEFKGFERYSLRRNRSKINIENKYIKNVKRM